MLNGLIGRPTISGIVARAAIADTWGAAQKLPICVEIDLIEQPDATLMRLTHTGLPNAEQCASHAEGWADT